MHGVFDWLKVTSHVQITYVYFPLCYHFPLFSHFFGFSLQLYKAFVPSMLEKGHGHIVTMASVAGFFGVPHLADYCASKYAVCGFEEAMFYELKLYENTSVKSTIIHPFFMNTGMFDGVQVG